MKAMKLLAFTPFKILTFFTAWKVVVQGKSSNPTENDNGIESVPRLEFRTAIHNLSSYVNILPAIDDTDSKSEMQLVAPKEETVVDCSTWQRAFASCAGEYLIDHGSVCNLCIARHSKELPDDCYLHGEVCYIPRDCGCEPCGIYLYKYWGCVRHCDFCPIPCPNQDNALVGCLQNKLGSQGDACKSCIERSMPTNPTTCSDFQDVVCNAPARCGCGSCSDEVATWIECNKGCFRDCTSTTPSSPPEPTPSPPPAPTCSSETAAYQTCMQNELSESQRNACVSCVIGAFPTSPQSCTDWKDAICYAPNWCGCGTCSDEIAAYLNCRTGCNIDCISLPCFTETTAYQTCFRDELSESQRSVCANCVNAAFPTSPHSCNDWSDAICNAPSRCGCQTCADEVASFLKCQSNCPNNRLTCRTRLS